MAIKRAIISMLMVCFSWAKVAQGMEEKKIDKGPFNFGELPAELQIIILDQLVKVNSSVKNAATDLGEFMRASKSSRELIVQNPLLITSFIYHFSFGQFLNDAIALKEKQIPPATLLALLRQKIATSFGTHAASEWIIEFRSGLLKNIFTNYFEDKQEKFLLSSLAENNLHYCFAGKTGEDLHAKWELLGKMMYKEKFEKAPENSADFLNALPHTRVKGTYCPQCKLTRTVLGNMVQKYIKHPSSLPSLSPEIGRLFLWYATTYMPKSPDRSELIDQLIKKENINVNMSLDDQGQTLLFLVLCNDTFSDEDTRELCTKYNPSVTAANTSGVTPLHHMTTKRRGLLNSLPEDQKEMIDNLAHWDIKQQWFEAIKNGNAEEVQELLRQDSGLVHERDQKNLMALHLAARHGNENVASILLQAGAEVDASGPDGCSPLMLGLEYPRMAKLLLLYGASLTYQNDTWSPAYSYLVYSNDKACIETVCNKLNKKQLADLMVYAAGNDNIALMNILYDQGIGYDVQGGAKTRRDPLAAASMWNNVEIVKFLISQGVPVNNIDNSGKSALWWAVAKGHVDIVKILLDGFIFYDRKEVVTRAIDKKQWEVLRLLMPHIDPSNATHYFEYMIKKVDNVEIIQEFVEMWKKNIAIKEKLFGSLVARNKWKTLKALLPVILGQQLEGFFLVAIAADAPQAIIEAFIKQGVNVNAGMLRDDCSKLIKKVAPPSFTERVPLGKALIRAVKTNNYETVQILINNGAKINFEVLGWAAKQNNSTLVEYLENAARAQKERQMKKEMSEFTVVKKPD